MAFVTPKVFLVGYTQADLGGIREYLDHTNQRGFMEEFEAALRTGISSGEALCSMYAKLCYASLVVGKNANISKTRAIADNLKGVIDTAHMSVFEHANLNFVATNVSRILTHEMVRHRAGAAYSQTSGRYVRPVAGKYGPEINFVHDPILDPVGGDIESTLQYLAEQYERMLVRLGMLSAAEAEQRRVRLVGELEEAVIVKHADEVDDLTTQLQVLKNYAPTSMDFDRRKKLTSALRRILPNGQSNEIGFTLNVRALRHTVALRTSRHAEWEIRDVFYQVFRIVDARFPVIFSDARQLIVPGSDVPEIIGMRQQPYDLQAQDLSDEDLLAEIDRREMMPDYNSTSEDDS